MAKNSFLETLEREVKIIRWNVATFFIIAITIFILEVFIILSADNKICAILFIIPIILLVKNIVSEICILKTYKKEIRSEKQKQNEKNG